MRWILAAVVLIVAGCGRGEAPDTAAQQDRKAVETIIGPVTDMEWLVAEQKATNKTPYWLGSAVVEERMSEEKAKLDAAQPADKTNAARHYLKVTDELERQLEALKSYTNKGGK
jgi:hypothetical protein